MRIQINSGIALLFGSHSCIFCQAVVNSARCIQLSLKIGSPLSLSTRACLKLSGIQGKLVPCILPGLLRGKQSPNLQIHLDGPVDLSTPVERSADLSDEAFRQSAILTLWVKARMIAAMSQVSLNFI